jgi:hypothetical protein
MGRPKKNQDEVIGTPKQKGPTIDDKIAMLQAQADAGDEAISQVMSTVMAFQKKAVTAKTDAKLSDRRLKNLVKGLIS